MSQFDTLKSHLSWIQAPLIVNAPMAIYASSDLATAVTSCNGLGQIGTLNEASWLDEELAKIQTTFSNHPHFKATGTLPIGVGFLLFLGKMDSLLPVVKKYRPAVVWMFAAPTLNDYTVWAKAMRSASPSSRIWIQTCSVAAALHIAEHTQPDALVVQGADAGGHGYQKGAGVITVLPEAMDALASKGFGHIPVLASGGVIDGRGLAAVMSLGAAGAVMGTRFLSAIETVVHPNYQNQILRASDGGQTTVRAKLFDELEGPNVWPMEYDARCLVSQSYTDHVDGVEIEQIRKSHSEALKLEHAGFGDDEVGRTAIWAGAGVGLVKQRQSAKEIIDDVKATARDIANALTARL